MTLNASIHWHRRDFQLNVDISCPSEGLTAIYGHSGAGKTTLLRCLAGLEQAPHSHVSFNDKTWQAERTFLAAYKRPIGFVFQDARLFEHLNVQQNLAFAEKRAGKGAELCSVEQAIELFAIAPLLQRYPKQLSGGEKQRVAIARTLLVKPHIIFMDEPLSSLDMAHKKEILDYLEKLKHLLRVPIIYVSHAADEIARLADYLVVLKQGKLLAQGPIGDLLTRLDLPIPLGEDAGVIIEAKIHQLHPQWHLAEIRLTNGQSLRFQNKHFVIQQPVRVRILARDVSVSTQRPRGSSIINLLHGQIVESQPEAHPATRLLKVKIGSHTILARITHYSAQALGIEAGAWVWLQIKSVAIVS